MNQFQIEAWIAIVGRLIDAGYALGNKLKSIIALFHPDHSLTDEQINDIERAGMLDSQRRAEERKKMAGTPTPDGGQ